MKIVKNINNNFAIAIDSQGKQLIVSGKGIGFGNVPRTISQEDLGKINRSYYDVDEDFIAMINEIPEDIISISGKIIDKARMKIDKTLSSNVIFTLADHINFALIRYQKNMRMKIPLIYDVKHLFETEYEIGLYGIDLLKKVKKVYLPEEEAAYIALHIINAEDSTSNNATNYIQMIDYVVEIIEETLGIHIDKETISFSRFMTHVYYLLKRGISKQLIESENLKLYETTKTEYPKTYTCALKISEYLSKKINIELSNEEILYLMLHINRLCKSEDCNH